jgi:hypothetical protein
MIRTRVDCERESERRASDWTGRIVQRIEQQLILEESRQVSQLTGRTSTRASAAFLKTEADDQEDEPRVDQCLKSVCE